MQNSLAALQKSALALPSLTAHACAYTRAELNEPSTLESKRKEAAGLEQLLTAYAANPALGDADEVQEGMLEAQRAVILLELERHANQADVAWMKESLGGAVAAYASQRRLRHGTGDLGGGRPHQLKPSAFPVPVACVVCGSVSSCVTVTAGFRSHRAGRTSGYVLSLCEGRLHASDYRTGYRQAWLGLHILQERMS